MVSATNAEWNVLYVATANGHGVVEGGSSDLLCLNQAQRVVGQLSGGNSTCTNLNGSIYMVNFGTIGIKHREVLLLS
jgi:hypothetical protein